MLKNKRQLISRAIGLSIIALSVGGYDVQSISASRSMRENPFITDNSIIRNLPALGFIAEAQILAQTQQSKTALVIGNAAYEDDSLRNPVNDATDVAQALRDLGFEVILGTNLEGREMDSVIEDFRSHLQRGGVGVFYYAGHGVQVNGENYLVPTDAELERERDAVREAISLSDLIELMESAEAAVNILMIDACRDNPFYRRWRSTRGSSPNRGLSATVPRQGTVISFATEPDGFADDGEGRNSPYTTNLLRHIGNEGEDILIMFRKVRAGVIESTNGVQIPWSRDLLTDSYELNPGISTATSPSPLPTSPSLPLPPAATSIPDDPVLISTTTQVNYQPLRDALSSGAFREADDITRDLMSQSVETQFDGYISAPWLGRGEIDYLPCEDFHIIDKLWSNYSNGQFGFSVQQEIYQRLGGTRSWDLNVWNDFSERVGWRKRRDGWLQYDDLLFNDSAPYGHLPWAGGSHYIVNTTFGHGFFAHLPSCRNR